MRQVAAIAAGSIVAGAMSLIGAGVAHARTTPPDRAAPKIRVVRVAAHDVGRMPEPLRAAVRNVNVSRGSRPQWWVTPPGPAPSGTATATIRRGTVWVWAEDGVRFSYGNNRVRSAGGWQAGGAVGLATYHAQGIGPVMQQPTAQHWVGRHTIGNGVPTPWGDVDLFTVDVAHELRVGGGGGHYEFVRR